MSRKGEGRPRGSTIGIGTDGALPRDSDSEVLSRMVYKRRMREGYAGDECVVHIPAQCFPGTELGAQLRLFHSMYPQFAHAIFPLINNYLSPDQIASLSMEGDGCPSSSSSPSAPTSESEFEEVKAQMLPSCHLLIPFLAKVTQIPICYGSSCKEVLKGDAMGRCMSWAVEEHGDEAICGCVTSKHICFGMRSGCVRVARHREHSAIDRLQTLRRTHLLPPAKVERHSFVNNRARFCIHSKPVYDVKVVDANEGVYASCAGDGVICLWDGDTGEERTSLRVRTGAISRIALAEGESPAQKMAAACVDSTARFFHLDRECCLRVLPHTGPVTAIALDDQGRFLLSGCAKETTVRMWDVRSAHPLRLFGDMDSEALFVGFVGENAVAAVSNRSKLYVWDVGEAAEPLFGPPLECLEGQRCTAMRIRGETVVLGSADGRIQSYNRGALVHRVDGARGHVMDISYLNGEWISLVK